MDTDDLVRTEDFKRARDWLRKRWGEQWPNEAHCKMLAEYTADAIEALQARVRELENVNTLLRAERDAAK